MNPLNNFRAAWQNVTLFDVSRSEPWQWLPGWRAQSRARRRFKLNNKVYMCSEMQQWTSLFFPIAQVNRSSIMSMSSRIRSSSSPRTPASHWHGNPSRRTSTHRENCSAALGWSGCEAKAHCDCHCEALIRVLKRFLYLWLFKDFIWIQNYYEMGLISIGVVAFWWFVCLFALLRTRKRTEM